jgi:hypothetical protein
MKKHARMGTSHSAAPAGFRVAGRNPGPPRRALRGGGHWADAVRDYHKILSGGPCRFGRPARKMVRWVFARFAAILPQPER